MAGKKRKRSPVEILYSKTKANEIKESSTPKKKKLSLTKHIKPPALEFAASPVTTSNRAADTITATTFDTPSGSLTRKSGGKIAIFKMPGLRKPSDDMDATLSNFSGQSDYRSYGSTNNAHDIGVNVDRRQEEILAQETVNTQEPDHGVKIWLQEILAEQKRGVDARLENINDNLVRLSNTVTQIHDAVLIGLGLDQNTINEANNQVAHETSNSEEEDADVEPIADDETHEGVSTGADGGESEGDLVIDTSAEASGSVVVEQQTQEEVDQDHVAEQVEQDEQVRAEQVHVVSTNPYEVKQVEIIFID